MRPAGPSGRDARPPGRQGLRRRPAGWPPSPAPPCGRPKCPPPWAGWPRGPATPPTASDFDEPPAEPDAVPPAGGWLRHGDPRGPLHRRPGRRSRTSLFRFARIVQSTPELRAALVDRDLAPPGPPGSGHPVARGQGASEHRLAGPLRRGRRPGPRHRRHAWTGWSSRRPRPAGWRIARVRAAAPIEEAQRSELSDSLTSLAGAPVELQVVIDEALAERRRHPDRRPAGGRQRPGTDRRLA